MPAVLCPSEQSSDGWLRLAHKAASKREILRKKEHRSSCGMHEEHFPCRKPPARGHFCGPGINRMHNAPSRKLPPGSAGKAHARFQPVERQTKRTHRNKNALFLYPMGFSISFWSAVFFKPRHPVQKTAVPHAFPLENASKPENHTSAVPASSQLSFLKRTVSGRGSRSERFFVNLFPINV